MKDYSQTCSFNTGLARELSIEAALVFDELSFWSTKGKRADGRIYKTLDDLAERLPIKPMTMRRSIDKLVEAGYIEKVIKKANGAPTMHFLILKEFGIVQSEQIDLSKMNSSESAVLNKSITAANTTTHIQDAAPAASLPATEKELLGNLNEVAGRNFRTLPRGVGKLLKLYSVPEIRQALDALAGDPWHKERLSSLSSDYLLRVNTIERFFAEGVAKQTAMVPIASNKEARIKRLQAIAEGEDEAS